jgi:tetratricopeptide (TPR) repeat protein
MDKWIVVKFLLIIGFTIILIAPIVKADDENDWYMRGENAVKIGQYNDAISYYNIAISINPQFEPAFSGKAYALNEMGNFSGALNVSELALAIKQDGRALNAKAFALFNLQRYDETVTAYNELFTVQSNLPDAYCNQGIAYENLNKTDQAIADFDKCGQLDPFNLIPWYEKGRVLLEIGKPQEALDAFNRCTQITIKNATVWNYKGEALLQLGRYQDALDCFKTATSLDPNYTDAKKNIDLAINHGQVYLIGTPTPTLRPVSAITPPTLVPVTIETTITTIQPTQTTEIVTIPTQTETSIPIKTTYSPLPAWITIVCLFCVAFIVLRMRRQ